MSENKVNPAENLDNDELSQNDLDEVAGGENLPNGTFYSYDPHLDVRIHSDFLPKEGSPTPPKFDDSSFP